MPTYLERSFGVFAGSDDITIRVRFSSEVARYVSESSWHRSQKLSPRRDGSLLAEFTLSATEEIKSWILSFGRHAVVLEPVALREEVREELMAMVTNYRKTVPGK